MIVKVSIKVVTGNTECFAVQNTEVTIDGNSDLIDDILAKIKEIPGVELR